MARMVPLECHRTASTYPPKNKQCSHATRRGDWQDAAGAANRGVISAGARRAATAAVNRFGFFASPHSTPRAGDLLPADCPRRKNRLSARPRKPPGRAMRRRNGASCRRLWPADCRSAGYWHTCTFIEPDFLSAAVSNASLISLSENRCVTSLPTSIRFLAMRSMAA